MDEHPTNIEDLNDDRELTESEAANIAGGQKIQERAGQSGVIDTIRRDNTVTQDVRDAQLPYIEQ